MGGYGAFLAALTHPERYVAAAALSPAIRIDQMDLSNVERTGDDPAFMEVSQNFKAVFGALERFEESEFSLKRAVIEPMLQEVCPRLLQLCGNQDSLLPMNQDYADFVKNNCPQMDFEFRISDGRHDFAFGNHEIQTVSRFFGL